MTHFGMCFINHHPGSGNGIGQHILHLRVDFWSDLHSIFSASDTPRSTQPYRDHAIPEYWHHQGYMDDCFRLGNFNVTHLGAKVAGSSVAGYQG